MRATPIMLGASSSVTRGHNLRLNKFRVKYDLRKYYFTSRVVNVWNCLSSFVVSADSVKVSARMRSAISPQASSKLLK